MNVPTSELQAYRDFIEALQEITEAKGAFKRDPFEHAKSCLRDMQKIAIDVLCKHGIEPRRSDEAA